MIIDNNFDNLCVKKKKGGSFQKERFLFFSVVNGGFLTPEPPPPRAYATVCEQNASYLAKHSELGPKKFKQKLRENYSKSDKIAITACEFSNIFGVRACPRTPLELLLFFSQLKISLVLPKKIRLKKILEIMSPSPF